MRARSSERGAVFVEALVVIVTFVVFLMGISYFRELYNRHINVGRLARAGAVAYSMGACDAQDPEAWATAWARADLAPGSRPQANQTATQAPTNQSTAVGGGEQGKIARGVMGDLPGAGTDDSMLNPIGHLGFSSDVKSNSRGKGFRSTASSVSYVSCGDKVRDGDFGEIVDIVTKHFPKPKL